MRTIKLLICSAVFVSAAAAQTNPRGHLIIVGGGPRPAEIMNTFHQLAGGTRGKILVLPMAAANATQAGESGVREFTRAGITSHYAVLDRASADSDTIDRVFAGVTGVWFPGGVQSRITRAMEGTRAHRLLRELYANGAVIGGTSAGAAIMTDPMITGDEQRPGGARRDTTDAWLTIEADNVGTTKGLGLLPNAIVDQHFLRRKRHNRLISLVLERPTMIGAGIDEATAIHVTPAGEWRVIGNGQVVIYDARKAATATRGALQAGGPLAFYVLIPGSVFKPATSTVTLGK